MSQTIKANEGGDMLKLVAADGREFSVSMDLTEACNILIRAQLGKLINQSTGSEEACHAVSSDSLNIKSSTSSCASQMPFSVARQTDACQQVIGGNANALSPMTDAKASPPFTIASSQLSDGEENKVVMLDSNASNSNKSPRKRKLQRPNRIPRSESCVRNVGNQNSVNVQRSSPATCLKETAFFTAPPATIMTSRSAGQEARDNDTPFMQQNFSSVMNTSMDMPTIQSLLSQPLRCSKRNLDDAEACEHASQQISSSANNFFRADNNFDRSLESANDGFGSNKLLAGEDGTLMASLLLAALGNSPNNNNDQYQRSAANVSNCLLSALAACNTNNLSCISAQQQQLPTFFNASSTSVAAMPNYAALANAFSLATASGRTSLPPALDFVQAPINDNLLNSVLSQLVAAATAFTGTLLPSSVLSQQLQSLNYSSNTPAFSCEQTACELLAIADSPTSSSSAPSAADGEIVVDDFHESETDTTNSPVVSASNDSLESSVAEIGGSPECKPSFVRSKRIGSNRDTAAIMAEFTGGNLPVKPPSAKPSPRNARGRRIPVAIKGQWTEEEDAKLVSLVGSVGTRNWSMISSFFDGRRVGKQCRERWVNHLDPSIRNTPWTIQEEAVIYAGQKRYGQQWSKISAYLTGRSDNHVKNHWYCHMQKSLTANDPKYDPKYAAQLKAQGELMRLDTFFSATTAPPQSHPHHPRSAAVPPIPLELLLGEKSSAPLTTKKSAATTIACGVMTAPPLTTAQRNIICSTKKSMSFAENMISGNTAESLPRSLSVAQVKKYAQRCEPAGDFLSKTLSEQSSPAGFSDDVGAVDAQRNISTSTTKFMLNDNEPSQLVDAAQQDVTENSAAGSDATMPVDNSFECGEQHNTSPTPHTEGDNDNNQMGAFKNNNNGINEDEMFLIPVRVQPDQQQQQQGSSAPNEHHRLVVMVSQQELVDILLDWAHERQLADAATGNGEQ